MKYILIPEDAEISGMTYSFYDCVTFIVDNDERFEKPASRIRAGARILAALDHAHAGANGYIELKDDDQALLYSAFEEPSAGYIRLTRVTRDAAGQPTSQEEVKVAPRTFLPFINAVSEAKNTEPQVEKAT